MNPRRKFAAAFVVALAAGLLLLIRPFAASMTLVLAALVFVAAVIARDAFFPGRDDP